MTRVAGFVTGVSLLALALTGCAGGRNFIRPQADILQLGKTTHAQVLERYGEPFRTGSQSRNGETITITIYSYATATPYVTDVPVRTAQFYFVRDVLIGYDFTSSFGDDKTKFDGATAQQIRRGETTRAQVLQLLGEPGGYYAYPLIKSRDDTALVYRFVDLDRTLFVPGSLRVTLKALVVSLDGDGITTDVDYTESAPGK